ncbi:MAG: dimethylarginine dimethylaminohydrolase family protein, partial [Chloroflexota bacterium]
MATTAKDRAWGGNTMVGKLERVLVFPPVEPDPSVSWQEFGYLRPLNHQQAVEEHEAFRSMLAADGVQVVTGEIDDPALQDAIFVFDPSFMTDAGAIICRMGKPLREPETRLARATMEELGIPIAGSIEPPGMVEGGDCLWIDRKSLAIGRGFRTNQAGIDQMRAILSEQDVEVIEVGLPYWNGPAECLHLLSLISMIDDDLAVVYRPLMEVGFLQFLLARGIELVDVPGEEFPTQGPNVLVTEPRKCIMLGENSQTAD